MRKTLCLLAALALSSLSNAASFSLDLSPTGGGAQNTVSLDGITPQDIFGYETDVWHGTITKSALSGQVSLNDGFLGLQLGGVADVGKGNFAGLKFDMPSGVESAKMSFTITYTSAWGAANFNCDYTCNVYGFTAEGTSTVIGTWSLQNAKASLTQNEPVDVSFDLQLDPDANYSSFGLIFNNTRVANAGGMGCEIFLFPGKQCRNRLRPLWDFLAWALFFCAAAETDDGHTNDYNRADCVKAGLCEEGMNYPLLFYFHSTQFFRFDGQGRMKWSTALIIKVFFKRAAYLLMTFF